MFKKAGADIEIFCDEQARCLRVRQAPAPIAPEFKTYMQEAGSYRSPREWEASPHYSCVTDEAIREEIDYFWIDLFYARPTQPPTP